ncbi:hypothetical protein O6H91_18G031500 [Diphasiastrum complanatum]|uniref:Uncharacterized protein n=1 Tax=Diphasiastrum complanatum TaxID=34168 RepID=A0ACC2AZM0_DIPCM|nr:hypothetical protein O6H91_18G031500 [Diphasiastrum complanatum]
MFVYLSKKVCMPQGLKVRSLAWNTQQGWLACGTEQGILKAQQTNLSMNQTLEGHHGAVLVVKWNQNYRKLTSSDDNGLIIVWILHKGMWFEEMINNRNKSVVRDMRWSSDGQRICIIYEDGQVILGNVDGKRLWGKDFKLQLSLIEWSPDGKLLLFCTREGRCLVYDHMGSYITQLAICFPDTGGNSVIIGIDWYNGSEGYIDASSPTLALGLQSGKLQLMKHELDEDPILVDTGMIATNIHWSPNGSALAVLGSNASMAGVVNSIVQIYSHYGVHLRSLHVPGGKLSDMAWEGGGLRLALAMDTYVCFANVRPEYRWSFFAGSTCVYSFKSKDHDDHAVMFWDVNSGEGYCKYVKHLVGICSFGDYCILATKGEELNQYILILCNAIGNPVNSKYTSVEPLFLAMNSSFAVAASEQKIYLWKFWSSGNGATANGSLDQICCICSSDKYLTVGRESGILVSYSLPAVAIEGTDVLQCRPQAISLNCDSTRLSVIDINGLLTFYDLHGSTKASKKVDEFKRKEVWNMKWADDNPDLIAVMEKTRMYVLRGIEPEEPITSSAYLCYFHNLQIIAIQLDDLMKQPEQPGKNHVFNYETKSLRDTTQILEAVPIQDAYAYVEEHSHPKLWISLAEHALEILDLSIAEKAFIKCKHYYGVQFVKRLHVLKDRRLQKAEVCVYFKRFDDAQRMYFDMDRNDLAISMRMKLGDWFIVEGLLESRAGNDGLLKITWDHIGDILANRKKWKAAIGYYEKSINIERLADCFYALGDWNGLEKLMNGILDGSPVLLLIAQKFQSVGNFEHAVRGFLKGGNIEAAIECCLELNQWDKAIELSKTKNCEQIIQEKLSAHTDFLLARGNPIHAIEIFKNTGRHFDAARVLKDLAKDYALKKENALDVKKLYHDNADGLGGHIKNVWHQAEAYHFLLLAHRAFYAGQFDQAMKASLWLMDYEDVLDLLEIYSLIGLSAFYNKHYAQCSKALNLLEHSDDNSERTRSLFSELALSIFKKYKPISPGKTATRSCPSCGTPVQELQKKCTNIKCEVVFPICIASGLLIVNEDRIQCCSCKHFMLSVKVTNQKHCPLCHALLNNVEAPTASVYGFKVSV